MDCIFCKIIKGEIPCYKVYEDEDTLAFLDIQPVNPGHTLVVPKQHFQNLEAIPEDLLAKVMVTVKKVAKTIKDNIAPGYNIQENNDPIAGQVIPHIHWHIIPRQEGDGLRLWSQRNYNDGEAEETLKKMKIN